MLYWGPCSGAPRRRPCPGWRGAARTGRHWRRRRWLTRLLRDRAGVACRALAPPRLPPFPTRTEGGARARAFPSPASLPAELPKIPHPRPGWRKKLAARGWTGPRAGGPCGRPRAGGAPGGWLRQLHGFCAQFTLPANKTSALRLRDQELFAEGRSTSGALRQFKQLEQTRLETRQRPWYRSCASLIWSYRTLPRFISPHRQSVAPPGRRWLNAWTRPCASPTVLSPSVPSRAGTSGTFPGEVWTKLGARAGSHPERPPLSPTHLQSHYAQDAKGKRSLLVGE